MSCWCVSLKGLSTSALQLSVHLTCRRRVQSCGPCSRSSARCWRHTRRCVRCRSRVGRWGSPSDPAGSDRTAGRTLPGHTHTDRSAGRRTDSGNPESRIRTLRAQTPQTDSVWWLVFGLQIRRTQRNHTHVNNQYQHAMTDQFWPLQPLGPNWYVDGAHLSQFLPTTLGRHWHWPPLGSHTVLREPWGSHWHSGKREFNTGEMLRQPTSFNRCCVRGWRWQI